MFPSTVGLRASFLVAERVELYDLRKDLGEKKDLAEAMPEKVKELQARLAAWQNETGAKMPGRN
jgi:arylsulfatase A